MQRVSCAGPPLQEPSQHLLAAELHAAQREAATLRGQLLAAEAAVSETTAAVEALTQDCAAGDRALAQLRAEHQATVLELELARDVLVSAQRAASDSQQVDPAISQLRAQHEEILMKLEAARNDLAAQQQAEEQLQDERLEAIRELEATRQDLRTCQQGQEQLRAKHWGTCRELDATKRDLETRQHAEKRLRSEHTTAQLEAVQHDLEISQQQADDADADRVAALQELGALREECQMNAHVTEELQRETRALQAAVERSQRELAAGEHEADALQQEHAVRLASRVGMSRARCCLR